MKVYFYSDSIHHKNKNAIEKYTNIEFISDPNRIDECLYIYSPCRPLDINQFSNDKKFIFGPHFSVFPNEQVLAISNPRCVYIQPSSWVTSLWERNPICKNLRISTLPFGVDTEKFNELKPISIRDKVFIYYKRRSPQELYYLEQFLKNKNISYRIFNYVERYSEQEYIDYLHNAKYGIVLDAHESQGFAIEEALASNVPLLVWNVSNMTQEYGSHYTKFPATSIPYWDKRCGRVFYIAENLESSYNEFISNLSNYAPREYIMENLSIEKCEQKFISLLNSF